MFVAAQNQTVKLPQSNFQYNDTNDKSTTRLPSAFELLEGKKQKPSQCGHCKEQGHNKATCQKCKEEELMQNNNNLLGEQSM